MTDIISNNDVTLNRLDASSFFAVRTIKSSAAPAASSRRGLPDWQTAPALAKEAGLPLNLGMMLPTDRNVRTNLCSMAGSLAANYAVGATAAAIAAP